MRQRSYYLGNLKIASWMPSKLSSKSMRWCLERLPRSSYLVCGTLTILSIDLFINSSITGLSFQYSVNHLLFQVLARIPSIRGASFFKNKLRCLMSQCLVYHLQTGYHHSGNYTILYSGYPPPWHVSKSTINNNHHLPMKDADWENLT